MKDPLVELSIKRKKITWMAETGTHIKSLKYFDPLQHLWYYWPAGVSSLLSETTSLVSSVWGGVVSSLVSSVGGDVVSSFVSSVGEGVVSSADAAVGSTDIVSLSSGVVISPAKKGWRKASPLGHGSLWLFLAMLKTLRSVC